MSYKIDRVKVWAGDFMNRPERLARVLEALAQAKADLEFLVARRVNENTTRIFVAPIDGKKQELAARDVGLVPAAGMHSLRIIGSDKRGLGAKITRAVAAAGVNIRGASAASVGRKSAFYVAFKTADEAAIAMKIIKKALKK